MVNVSTYENSLLFEYMCKHVYSESTIIANSVDRVVERNSRKQQVINRLSLCPKISDIPYSMYYFSCNLEHILHNEINLSDALEMEYAERCQDVYSCCTVVDEINNGGLNQLFFNSTGQFAKMSQDGFRALGNGKLSNIMRNAIEIYEKNKGLLEKYNDGTLESFSESYSENLFDELDDGFSEEEPSFDSLLEAYIRKNESVFGD